MIAVSDCRIADTLPVAAVVGTDTGGVLAAAASEKQPFTRSAEIDAPAQSAESASVNSIASIDANHVESNAPQGQSVECANVPFVGGQVLLSSSAGNESRDNLVAGAVLAAASVSIPAGDRRGTPYRDGKNGHAFSTESSLKPSEESRIREANRRLEILKKFWQQTGDPLAKTFDLAVPETVISRAQAAVEIEMPYTTIWRWERRYKKDGFKGLMPDTDERGRKSWLEKLGITPEQFQQIVDEVKGINLDTDSTTSAWRVYAQSDRCPENLAQVILDPNRCSKHAITKSLRRAVNITEAEKLAHRGPRALALGGIWTRRKLDILPGDVFCSDDTTPIWAWWVPWIQNEDYPFGVKLLQGQFLPVIDVASQKVLTFALIAREKSSYRAMDIWALFGHTFETVGLPRLGFQLERGSWEANLIAGQIVEYQEGELTLSRRVGGLRQLPTNITPWHVEHYGQTMPLPKSLQTWTSYLPKSKSIEAWFDRSQTLEGTLWGSLGRDQMRKPYEKMKKLFQECSRIGQSGMDPRQHFLSQAEIITELLKRCEYLNREPMEGEVFSGVPDLKFDQAVKDYPLFPLAEEEAWLYRRNWKPSRIDRGKVRVRLTHEISGERYSLFYVNPEKFAPYDGADVVAYYDSQNFEQPAQILLARTGEFLCSAEYEDAKGSFLDGDQTGHDMRKRWKNAVMAGYATIAKHAPSRQLPASIASRRNDAKAQTIIAPQTPPRALVPAVVPQRSSGPSADELQRRYERFAARANRARKLLNQPM